MLVASVTSRASTTVSMRAAVITRRSASASAPTRTNSVRSSTIGGSCVSTPTIVST
ncbi:hypothetical protein LRS13_15715 [Svornostia abyssi]|uniref:Secreted protein n=1 Tax=Svornostia abyssi TaxID=2898438 RepID=A0ABY5PC80_9ACTN|nr:hypothetical protein LRS13_15715 [Parviterribacteraceae bacterium J379]